MHGAALHRAPGGRSIRPTRPEVGSDVGSIRPDVGSLVAGRRADSPASDSPTCRGALGQPGAVDELHHGPNRPRCWGGPGDQVALARHPTGRLRTPRLVGGSCTVLLTLSRRTSAMVRRREGSPAPLLTPDVRTGAARSSTAPTRTVGAAWRRRRAALRPQPAARWGSLAPSTSCTAAPTGRAVGAARATRSRWPGPQPAGFGLPDLSGALHRPPDAVAQDKRDGPASGGLAGAVPDTGRQDRCDDVGR